MTTAKEAEKARQLKDLGWHLHCNRETGEWRYEKDGTDLHTAWFPKPGSPGLKEAAWKIQDGVESGQFGEAGGPASPGSDLMVEAICEELGRVQRLPHFHAVVAEDSLEELTEGRDDPRFTRTQNATLRAALDAAAARVGLVKSERAPGQKPAFVEPGVTEGEPPPAEAFSSETITPEAAPVGDEPAGDVLEIEDAPPAAGTLFEENKPADILRTQMLPSKIRTHPSLLMRAGGLNREWVRELREHLEAGGTFEDPVHVFHDGETYWLAEGNHRHDAAVPGGHLLDVVVHEGSLRDARLFAVRANARHGLKRSNDDKRLAVLTLLSDPEWHKMSDGAVAEATLVSQPFVSATRRGVLAAIAAGGLPPFREDEDEDKYAERVATQIGATEGLVRVLVNLPGEELEALTQNVMGAGGVRTGKDGREYAPAERAARPAPAGQERLLPGVVVEEPAAVVPTPAAPAGEAAAAASERADEELLAELKAAPQGVDTDELLRRGFTLEQIQTLQRSWKIERLTNGKCYYTYKPEDVAEALREHGPLPFGRLQEMGFQPFAITGAETEGLARRNDRGDYEALDTARAEEPAAQPAAETEASSIHREIIENRRTPPPPAPAAPQSPPPATPSRQAEAEKAEALEDLLKGRALAIGLVWIPGVRGKVQVSVNAGGKPQDAKRELVPAGDVRPLPAALLRLVKEALGSSNGKGAAKRAAPAKPAPKSLAKPAAAKKGAAKKAAAKGGAKAKAKKSPAKKGGKK